MERQCERARAHFFRHGTEADAEAEPLLHVRLEVDAREIAGRRDAMSVEVRDDGFSIGPSGSVITNTNQERS